MALLDSDGTVETALIGPIPKSILKEDLDVLLSNSQLEKKGGSIDEGKRTLPHVMYDAFRNKPDMKKVSFDEKWFENLTIVQFPAIGNTFDNAKHI